MWAFLRNPGGSPRAAPDERGAWFSGASFRFLRVPMAHPFQRPVPSPFRQDKNIEARRWAGLRCQTVCQQLPDEHHLANLCEAL